MNLDELEKGVYRKVFGFLPHLILFGGRLLITTSLILCLKSQIKNMKPSHELFRLIKSLSKSEKRFFQINVFTSIG